MISRKSGFILLLFLIVVIVSACANTQSSEEKIEKSSSISYEKYRSLFDRIGEELAIPNFEMIEKTDTTNIIGIDETMSFGKRTILTLNGDQEPEETQERVIFENKDSGQIILLDLIYLDAELDKDMVFWPATTTTYKEEKILQQFEEAILAYNNILVKITQISSNEKLNSDDFPKTINAVTDYLQNYKH